MTYEQVYRDTRNVLVMLSGLNEWQLADAATELQVDYEMFCMDYDGPYVPDSHIGFTEMLRNWGDPSIPDEWSSLNGLTEPQLFCCWAWNQNEMAEFCLDGKAVANGWKSADATECGEIAALSAAKSLAHARQLMATGTEGASIRHPGH